MIHIDGQMLDVSIKPLTEIDSTNRPGLPNLRILF